MRTFVDTSALYALVDEQDQNHEGAVGWFTGPGSASSEVLLTHSYVVVETTALVSRRLGRDPVRLFLEALVPATSVLYVDETLHRFAVTAYLAAGGRRASLVDAVSFEMMRDQQIDRAFAFDRDFAGEGFTLVP
ncbi:MAG TPA: PIN domain-containing protein [Acidimicrobiia bacterium]|nr:PIN domain-containing protein [Acidimicrobiia bacterium]